jgi:hypothetical protein
VQSHNRYAEAFVAEKTVLRFGAVSAN